ncbi:MAG: hypothetical protein KDA91_07160, partial [Planctomycetaceae bacterium]|nr:hypothetical protein [Planctomycetaceae bacterium]
MTDSQRSNSRVAVLDEAAVHTLLGDFFRQEIPTQLDAAFDVHVVRATRNLAETGATAAASATPALIPAQRSVAVAPDTATRRFTVISALSALAACVTLVISVSSVSFPDGLVRKTRAIAPITSETELL